MMALELVGGFNPSEASPQIGVSVGVLEVRSICQCITIRIWGCFIKSTSTEDMHLHIYSSNLIYLFIYLSTYLLYLIYLPLEFFLFYPSMYCNDFLHVMTNRILTFDSTVSS